MMTPFLLLLPLVVVVGGGVFVMNSTSACASKARAARTAWDEELLVEAAKRHILSTLNLKERPRSFGDSGASGGLEGGPRAPLPRIALRAAMEETERSARRRRDEAEEGAEEVRLVRFAQRDATGHILLFSLPPLEEGLDVSRAYLWLHVAAAAVDVHGLGHCTVTISSPSVTSGGAGGVNGSGEAIGRAHWKVRVRVSNPTRWVRVCLTQPVRSALRRGEGTLALGIAKDGCGGGGGGGGAGGVVGQSAQGRRLERDHGARSAQNTSRDPGQQRQRQRQQQQRRKRDEAGQRLAGRGATGRHGEQNSGGQQEPFQDLGQRPFLVMSGSRGDSAASSSSSWSSSRVQRDGGDSGCEASEGRCCLQRFYVDFKKIGWHDWILVPEGYFANFCRGSCPPHVAGTPGTAASFHSVLINQYRLRGLQPANSQAACCVPTRLGAMSLLYYDEGDHVVKRNVPDIVAEACGCA